MEEEEEEQGGKLGEHSKLGGVTLLPPQTFLARKGPMGTVRCAAHLQHRLKKSQYTSTDISSTVGQSLEFQQHSEAPPCAISEEVPEISFGIHHINWPFDRLLLYSNKNQEGGRESFLMTPPCCQMHTRDPEEAKD
ncbi:hypothetical protein ACOSQ2_024202 [Xanthoceras sorbifolium]